MTADRGYARTPDQFIIDTTEEITFPSINPRIYRMDIKFSFIDRLRFLFGMSILLRINLMLGVKGKTGEDKADYCFIESWRQYEIGVKS